MVNINILFDGLYNDVDIIAVPNDIVQNIDKLAQEFLHWIPPEDDEDGWVVIHNNKCLAKETIGFIKWLNANYCATDKAYIVQEHVQHCSKYQTIEF